MVEYRLSKQDGSRAFIGSRVLIRRTLLAIMLLASLIPFGCTVPRATRAQRAEVQVVLYSTRWCPACGRTRAWLDSRGIRFRDRDVESSRAASATLSRLNPARTVPTVDVEGTVIVGLALDELREAIDRAALR